MRCIRSKRSKLSLLEHLCVYVYVCVCVCVYVCVCVCVCVCVYTGCGGGGSVCGGYSRSFLPDVYVVLFYCLPFYFL